MSTSRGSSASTTEAPLLVEVAAELFPLLDPGLNPSPFPDRVWVEFVQTHNAEQMVNRRIWIRLFESEDES